MTSLQFIICIFIQYKINFHQKPSICWALIKVYISLKDYDLTHMLYYQKQDIRYNKIFGTELMLEIK